MSDFQKALDATLKVYEDAIVRDLNRPIFYNRLEPADPRPLYGPWPPEAICVRDLIRSLSRLDPDLLVYTVDYEMGRQGVVLPEVVDDHDGPWVAL